MKAHKEQHFDLSQTIFHPLWKNFSYAEFCFIKKDLKHFVISRVIFYMKKKLFSWSCKTHI